MSNTTKDEKPTMLDDLKAQASALAAKIKEATDSHLQTLHEKLKEAHATVEKLTAEIRSHSSEPIPAPARRGRKPSGTYIGNRKPAKATTKVKGQRGAVGAAITAFVSSKGKAGAHVKDIAKHLGSKPTTVTAFFYANANRKKFKKVKPATFALAK